MIKYSPINTKIWSKLGSCGAFGVAAMEIPEINDNILMLTADLTFFSGLERFKNKFPDKFYNIGIAEQNMLGIAAGLAKEGFPVFANTYASFAATRSCEQAKLYMGYSKYNIKLVGLTSGLSVGILGGTHSAMEDIAIMRSIPNVTILSPSDCTEVIKATLAAAEFDGPVYLRLTGGVNVPIVYKEDYEFTIGKAITLREGLDVTIIATGSMVSCSLAAAELLAEQNISATVVNMHTIKPLDTAVIDKAIQAGKLMVTVEEHSVIGGLGGAVAEYKSAFKNTPAQLTIGIPDQFGHAGDYQFMLEKCGLTAKNIAKRIIDRLKDDK